MCRSWRYGSLRTTGLEACWGIVNYNESDMGAFVAACEEELDKWVGLMVYCGQAWLNIAMEHKCSVPFIAKDSGSWKVRKYHVYKCISKTDLADKEKLTQAVRQTCVSTKNTKNHKITAQHNIFTCSHQISLGTSLESLW